MGHCRAELSSGVGKGVQQGSGVGENHETELEADVKKKPLRAI